MPLGRVFSNFLWFLRSRFAAVPMCFTVINHFPFLLFEISCSGRVWLIRLLFDLMVGEIGGVIEKIYRF